MHFASNHTICFFFVQLSGDAEEEKASSFVSLNQHNVSLQLTDFYVYAKTEGELGMGRR